MDLTLVLIEDVIYVWWSARCRTFEVGDLWDCFVVSGLVIEDDFTAEGLVFDFLFEGVLYGFVPSLVNIPANGIQGFAGLIIGIILIRVFEKNKIISG